MTVESKSPRRIGRRWPVRSESSVVGRSGRGRDEGFTLVELLIVLVVSPMIVGALSLMLMASFTLSSRVSTRLATTGDAQLSSAQLFRDVQSATRFTTLSNPSGPAQCGTGTQVLGLLSGAVAYSLTNIVSATVVSYSLSPNGVVATSGQENNLVRQVCSYTGGSSPTETLTSTTIVSYNEMGTISPQVSGVSCSPSACSTPGQTPWATTWAYTTGIQGISMLVNEATTNAQSYTTDPACAVGSAYCFTLAAAPREWTQISGGNPVIPPSGVTPIVLLSGNGLGLNTCTSKNAAVSANGPIVLNTSNTPDVQEGNGSGNKVSVYGTYIDYNVASTGPTNPPVFGSKVPMPTPEADPLAYLPAPPTTGLPTDPPTVTGPSNGAKYYKPGIYNSSDPLTGPAILESGVYILNGTGVVASGQLTSGPGGTLVYVTQGSVAPAGLVLSPLTSGTYNGISLFQGPAASAGPPYDTNPLTMSGNGVASIGGVLYAPYASFNWTGTDTMLVGDLVVSSSACNGGGNGNGGIYAGFSQSITITTPAPSTAAVGSTYTPAATGGASLQPVIFTIDGLTAAGVCSMSVGVVHFKAAGTCLIDADQGGAVNSAVTPPVGYTQAPTVQQSVNVL